ncbi:MAG: hypothetical protein ACRCZO_04335 [Cetobacterium sp.]|uniref:hypothetical protein n=1 Tax=Cetobacterium sp. TaxID=2071632 RepID=UPI003EE51495
MFHTGEDASTQKGNFECIHCKNILTMHGNYKDKFPPCPWEKIGTDYVQVSLITNGSNNSSEAN